MLKIVNSPELQLIAVLFLGLDVFRLGKIPAKSFPRTRSRDLAIFRLRPERVPSAPAPYERKATS